MINIAICDDEQSVLDWISKKTTEVFNNKSLAFNISTFKNGNILLNAHNLNKFDIVFLDIDMKPIDGFETAKKIKEIDNDTYIVFVTSKHHLMKDSFDYQPFNFICKDSLENMSYELERICNKLIRIFKQNKIIRIYDTVEGAYDIPICDLMYINSEKHYLTYHILLKTETGKRYLKLKERGTISQKEAELLDFDFLKPHRRYLVNMRHISRLDKVIKDITLLNNEKIPVSQKSKEETIKKYLIFKRR